MTVDGHAREEDDQAFCRPEPRAGRVYRHVLPLRGLRRGDYKVRIEAVARDDEQIAATLVTRRM